MRLWVKESGRDWGSRIIRTTCPGRGGSSIMRVRLDRWLWAARFFKTRALAAAAIGGGKVEVAAALYAEDPDAKRARERLTEQLRLAPSLRYEGKGRPTKRERRAIERLKGE